MEAQPGVVGPDGPADPEPGAEEEKFETDEIQEFETEHPDYIPPVPEKE